MRSVATNRSEAELGEAKSRFTGAKGKKMRGREGERVQALHDCLIARLHDIIFGFTSFLDKFV
ncbi:MAG: hypothetical protein A2Z69_03525 [Bacteroidetes bacterium RBG_13_44_24]|nr:MAG: hypothetical protein A2Z69_03525 [Bacteroidetes bacterium RBG_13_44_24]